MNEYEIRFKTQTGQYVTCVMTAVNSGRAIITWRQFNPTAKLLWMKRKDGVPGSTMDMRDRRLPREPD